MAVYPGSMDLSVEKEVYETLVKFNGATEYGEFTYAMVSDENNVLFPSVNFYLISII